MKLGKEDEINILHEQLHESRRISFGLLMAFVHLSAENTDIPLSWLLGYLVNNDRGILDCDSIDEWPDEYVSNLDDFCTLVSLYIGADSNFPPVMLSAQTMRDWIYTPLKKKILH